MTWSICIKHSTETKHNIYIENRVKQQSIEMAEETSTAETKKKKEQTQQSRAHDTAEHRDDTNTAEHRTRTTQT